MGTSCCPSLVPSTAENDQEGCYRSWYKQCATIPGLHNLLAVSHALEVLAHGLCLLSLELNGNLITAAADAALLFGQTPAARFADMLPGVAATQSRPTGQHALTGLQLYSRQLPEVPSPEVC